VERHVTAVLVVLLVLVAVAGTAVVLERDPLHQVMVFGFFGMLLAALFLALQAPDVALSELVVGAVLMPGLVLFTLVKVRADDGDDGSG
jgi:uncharacterized MnhB-related membrane protein